MTPIDAFWHIANLFAAPFCVTLLLVLLAKGLVWRRALAGAAWRRLWLESTAGACLGVVLALLWLGVDGKLAGYALWLGLGSLPLAWRLVRSA
jgi:hypothetical protein